ncbi:MAG: TonB-dependent receptor [Gemmatimonadaceae bacterium]|nr:TonB-dependent receptor [Gemmatimonadaceae bacterium]
MRLRAPFCLLTVVSVCAAGAPRPLLGQPAPRRAAVGTVRDARSGRPIGDVTVEILGTVHRALSDASGRFALATGGADSVTLRFSRPGLTPLTRRVAADAPLEIALTPLAQTLAAAEVTERRIADRRTEPTPQLFVDREEIARFDDQTIADVLRRQSGIVMGGPPGAAKDVRMRGLDKEYTQTLVDGRRFPDGGEKREFNVDRLSAALVERVEIIRGPTATMPAQGAGGTVNIVMRDVPVSRLAEFGFTGGRAGPGAPAGDGYLVAGNRHGRWGWLLDGSYLGRSAPQAGKDKITSSAREAEVENLDVRTLNLMPRLAVDATSRDVLVFEPTFIRTNEAKGKTKRRLTSAGAPNGGEVEDETKDRNSHRLRGQWRRQLANAGLVRLDVGTQQTVEDKIKGKDTRNAAGVQTVFTDEIEDKKDRELFALGEAVIGTLGAHRTTVGGEWVIRDRLKNKRIFETRPGQARVDRTGAKDVYEIDEGQASLWLQDQWTVTARSIVTAGVRAERIDHRAVDRLGSVQTQDGWIVAPSVNVLQQVSGGVNLRASASRTVRRPKFDDVIPYVETRSGSLAAPDRIGNPDLRPEHITSAEVGAERFVGASGVVGVTVYRKWIRDVQEVRILQGVNGNSRFTELPVNAGNGTLDGIDVDARGALAAVGLPQTTLYATGSLFRSRLLAASGAIRRFPNQPDYVVNLGFDHALPRLGLSFGMNANRVPGIGKGEIKDGVAQLAREDVGDRVDLYIAQRIAGFTVRLSGQNVLASGKDKATSLFDANGRLTETVTEREVAPRFFFVGVERRF